MESHVSGNKEKSAVGEKKPRIVVKFEENVLKYRGLNQQLSGTEKKSEQEEIKKKMKELRPVIDKQKKDIELKFSEYHFAICECRKISHKATA